MIEFEKYRHPYFSFVQTLSCFLSYLQRKMNSFKPFTDKLMMPHTPAKQVTGSLLLLGLVQGPLRSSLFSLLWPIPSLNERFSQNEQMNGSILMMSPTHKKWVTNFPFFYNFISIWENGAEDTFFKLIFNFHIPNSCCNCMNCNFGSE